MSYDYVVDSSVWVEYFNGTEKGNKVKAIIEEENIAASIMTIAELADKFSRENKPFDDFLQFILSRSAIIQLDIELILNAAKIKKEQRSKKPKFGIVDAIHLATAQKEKSTFLTLDKDFSGINSVIIL